MLMCQLIFFCIPPLLILPVAVVKSNTALRNICKNIAHLVTVVHPPDECTTRLMLVCRVSW